MSSPAFFSLQTAADYLGVSLSTIKRQVRNGRLPVARLGARVLISRTNLEALVSAGIEPDAEPEALDQAEASMPTPAPQPEVQPTDPDADRRSLRARLFGSL